MLKGTRVEGWQEKITHISQNTEKTFASILQRPGGSECAGAEEHVVGGKVRAPKILVEHYPEQLNGISEVEE
jgi:hypothetical protein